MVLSNKRLKRKIRDEAAAAAAKLTASSSAPYVLDQVPFLSTCCKRLSKRQKRRQQHITAGLTTPNGFVQAKQVKRQKRCQLEGEGEIPLKKTQTQAMGFIARPDMEEKDEVVNYTNTEDLTAVTEIRSDASSPSDIGNNKKTKRKTRKKGDEHRENEKLRVVTTSNQECIEDFIRKCGKVDNKDQLRNSKVIEAVIRGDDQTIATNQHNSLLKSSELHPQYDAKRVYVGGIPYYCSENDIRSYFSECGTITEVCCMTFQDTGKFRGIALLSFMTEAAAKRALALDGADMGGRFLKIQPWKDKSEVSVAKQKYTYSPSKVEGCTRAYIGNLSWDITEDSLRTFFKNCKINHMRLALDKSSGKSCGYGHIDFVDDISLELAMQLDQKPILGRPIKIAYAIASSTRGNMKPEY